MVNLKFKIPPSHSWPSHWTKLLYKCSQKVSTKTQKCWRYTRTTHLFLPVVRNLQYVISVIQFTVAYSSFYGSFGIWKQLGIAWLQIYQKQTSSVTFINLFIYLFYEYKFTVENNNNKKKDIHQASRYLRMPGTNLNTIKFSNI